MNRSKIRVRSIKESWLDLDGRIYRVLVGSKIRVRSIKESRVLFVKVARHIKTKQDYRVTQGAGCKTEGSSPSSV
jgi:hypothetical protein